MKIPLFHEREPNEKISENDFNVDQGVVCFDFSRHNPQIFVAGLEGGLVVQCSTLGATQLIGTGYKTPKKEFF